MPGQTEMMRLAFLLGAIWVAGNLPPPARGESLALPPRPPDALTGSQVAARLAGYAEGLSDREAFIRAEFLRGNVPDLLRQLATVSLTNISGGRTNLATIFITPDYLALGRDDDYLLLPMTPETAQQIADTAGCLLPTPKLVDAIYAAAAVKLSPQPMTPDARMTTIPAFVEHQALIQSQRLARAESSHQGALTAGHKKDVVITPRLVGTTNRVALYGWHRADARPIQPLYLGHRSTWVDYSHGIRLVSREMLLNGQRTNVAAVLADPNWSQLLSDEGPLLQSRYVFPDADEAVWPQGFRAHGQFGELTRTANLPDGVRVVVNTPPARSFAPDRPVQLIYYAVPNGNSIEQTIGKSIQPGDDWHFDIQHIGAQIRFLRAAITNRTLVIAYLENSQRSWPAWRREHGNSGIPTIIETVRAWFKRYPVEIVLTGHSGGGSLTFGYLEALPDIPDPVRRIAFLDSNYAYETTNHLAKLNRWLRHSDENQLCILAYEDHVARLNGKAFVSERGGTWGRSHAMLHDLRTEFPFVSRTNDTGLQVHETAGGQVALFLRANPERKIWHTVQVERNGFIHAMSVGTPAANRGYEYLGSRAYSALIQAE
jgi:hypothetical protein